MQDLIREYQEQIAVLRQKKNRCNDFSQKKSYASMIESLTFAIAEMSGNHRVDTRTILVEPTVLTQIATVNDIYPLLDNEEREADAAELKLDMRSLSRQESRVLRALMDGVTFQELADEMGVGKSTIQKYAERAKQKLNRMRYDGVQCALFDEFDDTDGVYLPGLFRQQEPEFAVH